MGSEAELITRAVDDLLAGRVIGWYQGRFEWGPRALGSRSILADARRADMKDVVNVKVKFREPFRPFAPSVLAEHAAEWFDLPGEAAGPTSRFMLCVCPVRAELRHQVPAITHVDGSSRPQLVDRDANPRYHSLLSEFYHRTGVPLVLNTSFNLKGEPIVASPADAVSTFARCDLDVLYLGSYRVAKPAAGAAGVV